MRRALRAVERFLEAKSVMLVLFGLAAYDWGGGYHAFGVSWVNPLITLWWGSKLFVSLLRSDRARARRTKTVEVPGGLIITARPLTGEDADRLRTFWLARHSGGSHPLTYETQDGAS